MELIEDPQWYRAAEMRPRLRMHVRVQRRVTRDRAWYVLGDDERRRYQRLDSASYQFVGRLDGNTTVDEAWRAVHERLGEDAPTQTEVLGILSRLNESELLTINAGADTDGVIKRRRERERRIKAAAANPLSFKVPLFDPSSLLLRLLPLSRWLFSRSGMVGWLVLMLAGISTALTHFTELKHAVALHGGTASFLVRIWVLYPLVKIVHEASHAMAVRRWGAEVREVGLNVVMLTPLPYVDASGATGFQERGRRMVVSAAGVMAELVMAVLALFVWTSASSDGVKLTALAVMAGCGLSTLLFNANPLARFDGYYFVSDWLDLPNLQSRGRAMVAHLAQKALNPANRQPSPEPLRREAVLVTGYAVASWIYQVVAIGLVAYWLFGPSTWIACAVLLFGAWSLILRPLINAGSYLFFDSRLNGLRPRALSLAGGVLAAVLVLLFAIPAPSFTVQQGIVWTPPEAIVRVETQGELDAMKAAESQRVEPGQVIAQLDNLELRSEREAAAVRALQLDVQYFDALLTQPLTAAKVALDRSAAQARLQRLDEQLDKMTLRAQAHGTLVVPRDSGQTGHSYREGKEFGFIVSDRPETLVKVVLTEAQAALVRNRTTAVSVRLVSSPKELMPATLERETPGVTRMLPSAILGSAAGGPIANDPSDKDGRQTLTPVAVVDVVVPGHRSELIGAKAWVRFDHLSEPLGQQWARALQQTFLARLGART